jgi:hypothetical protein
MTFIATQRGAQSRLWTPKDLGVSLSLWLDGTDLSTQVISGTKIFTWYDKSVYGNHLSNGNSATQPLNLNPPAVQNSTGIITSSVTSNVPLGTADRSMIFVSSMYSGRANVGEFPFMYGGTTGTSGFGYSFYCTGSGSSGGDGNSKNFQAYNGSAYAGPAAGVNPTIYNSTQMISVIASNQNVIMRGNGTQVYSGAFSFNTTAGAINVFNNAAGNGAMQGSLYDMFLIDSADISVVAKVEGYLAWKRGLVSSLPASHLYKLQPPKKLS